MKADTIAFILKSKKAQEMLGPEGIQGLEQLQEFRRVEKAVNSFLSTLPEHVRPTGRIHTCMNLNTATGRISSRSPNLQQIPSQDTFLIRRAFCAPAGKKFVVADYGQLELRVMAHMAADTAMINALIAGGDFHSRTASEMFPHVAEAVERGDVLIESETHGVKTVKTAFGTERGRAKTLNFGIAYGLSARSIVEQCGVTSQEAEQMIKQWYDARPQVKAWKGVMEARAAESLRANSLRGRPRWIPELEDDDSYVRWKGRTIAVNSPIQGGAADIVMEAMIRLEHSEELRRTGFKLVLQIHDEVVLEGPEGDAEEALRIVTEIMERPFLDGETLRVPLPVDAKVVHDWSEAK